MHFSKLIAQKKQYKSPPGNIPNKLYKGACVKIKNSNKTFQVVGLNPESEVCWIREWPFNLEGKKTFSLEIDQITLQTFCSNHFSEN